MSRLVVLGRSRLWRPILVLQRIITLFLFTCGHATSESRQPNQVMTIKCEMER
jgi:hypothetical protein